MNVNHALDYDQPGHLAIHFLLGMALEALAVPNPNLDVDEFLKLLAPVEKLLKHA